MPGKVAKELPYGSAITVLEQVVRRLRKCRFVDEVIVATTTDRADDALVRLTRRAGAKLFRGSREDVLARYFGAAMKYRLDTVVRITSDCPCVDPSMVDSLVTTHLRGGSDYTSNVLKLTYPDGYDCEVFSLPALERAESLAAPGPDREHVTSFLRSHPQLFKLKSVEAPRSYRRPDLRVTLDTPEDYALLCAIYDYLYPRNRYFSISDVFGLLQKKPWLQTVNSRCMAKKVVADEKSEYREAATVLELQELRRAAAVMKRLAGKGR